MRIRIISGPLKKAQDGLTFPKIDMFAPVDPILEPSKEEAPAEYFQKPAQKSFGQQAIDAGIGPSFKMDAVDQKYQSDPAAQMQYDFSLYDYHKNKRGKDTRNYNKFMQNKYDIQAKKKGNLTGLSALIGLGSAITDYVGSNNTQKEFDRWMQKQQMSDNLFPSVAGSRGDYVTTGTSFGMFRPDQYVVNKGMYTAEEGGENPTTMNTIRIRIVDGPQSMEYGGQSGYGLDLGQRKVFSNMNESQYDSVSNTMGPVPREEANIEAEKGETVYGDLDGDGAMEHMNIGGKRHVNGGTPLSVPEGSFIFSDTKKMVIKDEEILKQFGLSPRSGGYTPAQIAKRYDINKYKAIMEDPNADPISKQTAQLMVEKYNEKLSLLAMVQESMKGFPQGVPQVAAGEMEDADMESSEELPEAQLGGWAVNRNNGNILDKYRNRTSATNRRTTSTQTRTTKPARTNNPARNFNNPQEIADYYKQFGYTGNTNIDELQKWMIKKAKTDPAFGEELNNYLRTVDLTNRGRKLFGENADKLKLTLDQLYDNFNDGLWDYRFPKIKPKSPNTKPQPKGGWVCTDNGVKYVGPNDPLTGWEPYGFYDTEAEARAVCKGKPEEKIPPGTNDFKGNDPLPFGWMTPDMVNMFAAAALPPKKYLPYMAPYKTITPDPTFYDPNRELAANAEQANIQGQYLANFAGPQSFLANMSGVQGKAAENAANILGRYNNLNVGVANDFSVRNADIKNREMLANTERANELFKGNVIANEQYRNAQRQYLNNLAKTFGTAWNNRMNLGMLNAVNPMYNINPITGRSYFKKGYNPSMLSGFSSSSPAGGDYWRQLNAGYLAAKQEFPELTATKYLDMMRGTTTSSDRNADGIPDSSRTTAQNMLPFYQFSAFGGPISFPF